MKTEQFIVTVPVLEGVHRRDAATLIRNAVEEIVVPVPGKKMVAFADGEVRVRPVTLAAVEHLAQKWSAGTPAKKS